MFHSVELSDYMLHKPATIGPQADIFEAVASILDNRISGLCVVDAQGMLLGVLSELDCLKAILSATYEGRRYVGVVGDYMTPAEGVSISAPVDDIVDVANEMVRNGRRRRPVVRDGKLVGQITCRQLLRAISDFSASTALPKVVNG